VEHLSGITLLDEREGEGRPAQKGDRVVYNTRIFLNHGDEVPLNRAQADHLPQSMSRLEDGGTLIDHTIMLGRRQAIAGIEHALMGMKAGGYRKVRISPHLAYRDKGIPDMIPPDAVLVCEIWLRHLEHKEIL
jgi:FKBP-type peptidyl-prolyl cis-trans isomerase (trigger factor)